MIIKKITYDSLSFTPVAERRVKVSEDMHVRIYTDNGVLDYKIKLGYYTDFRSGGKIVDFILPWMSTPLYTLAVLIHDINYSNHCLSFDLSNDLFSHMLRYSGLGKFKTKIALFGVSGCLAREAYDNADMFDKLNNDKIFFEWLDK